MRRVKQLADSENVKSALWMGNAIDTGDTGLAIFSGVKSALGFFFGDKKEALETDSQQGVDCGLKLLGIAYMAHKLFPGSMSQKAQSFYATPSGQALAFYFAAQDTRALAVLYAEAADDPLFTADNEAIQADFASLDREVDAPDR